MKAMNNNEAGSAIQKPNVELTNNTREEGELSSSDDDVLCSSSTNSNNLHFFLFSLILNDAVLWCICCLSLLLILFFINLVAVYVVGKIQEMIGTSSIQSLVLCCNAFTNMEVCCG